MYPDQTAPKLLGVVRSDLSFGIMGFIVEL